MQRAPGAPYKNAVPRGSLGVLAAASWAEWEEDAGQGLAPGQATSGLNLRVTGRTWGGAVEEHLEARRRVELESAGGVSKRSGGK